MKFFKLKKKRSFSKVIPQNYLFTKIKKKKKRILLNLFYLTLLFLLLGLIFYSLFFLSYFQVKNISFEGMRTVSEDNLRAVFSKYIGEKSLFLKNDNIFVLSSGDLSERMEKSFRRIKKVDIKKDFPDSLKIFIEEFKAAGISCKDSLGQKNIENLKKAECFYFDKDGVVFDSAPLIVSDLLVFLYDKNIDINDFPDNFYEKKTIDFILKLKKEISEKIDFPVSYFSFLNEYGDVEAVFKTGFKLLLSQEQDPIFQVRAAKDVLENKVKDNPADLDYIDLRIQKRAYYKLKIKDNLSSEEATTTNSLRDDINVN